MKNFTQKDLNDLVKTGVPTQFMDPKTTGLLISVTVAGATFKMQHRIKGHSQLLKPVIGKHPVMKLDTARRIVLEKMPFARAGINPFVTEKVKTGLYLDEAKRYIEEEIFPLIAKETHQDRIDGKTKYYKRVQSLLTNKQYFGPIFNVPVDQIDVDKVYQILLARQKIHNSTAMDMHTYIGKFIAWWKSKSLNDRRYFAWSIPRVGEQRPSDPNKIVTDKQITAILKAAKHMGYPWGDFYKMMILTAQRKGNIAKMRWDQIDFEANTYTWDRANMKNGMQLKLLMTPQIRALLLYIRDVVYSGEMVSPWVFTTMLTKPIKPGSKIKTKMDWLSETSGWVNHDIRRSITKHASEKTTAQKEHVDAILAHKKGVGEINYGVAASQKLVLEVLTKWNNHLDDLTGDGPETDNVVTLKTA